MAQATAEPTPWLPSNALSRERLQALLELAIGPWSSHWFANAQAGIAPAYQDDWPEAASGERQCMVDGLAGLSTTPASSLHLAAAMLSASVPQASLQNGEKAVVEALAGNAADDLLRRVQLLASGEPARAAAVRPFLPEAESMLWDISIGTRRNVLKLAISKRAAIGMVKRALAAPRPIRLEAVATAVAKGKVQVGAAVGRCVLSLAELENLSTGDVLVLDSPAAGPAELLINGSPTHLVARLEPDGERPRLILVHSGKANV